MKLSDLKHIDLCLVETITLMILEGDIVKAKAEILADKEYTKITGKPRQLNDLQERELLASITEYEIRN